MKNVAKVLILLLIIIIVITIAFFKQMEYKQGFNNASEFFSIRNEIKSTLIDIGKEEHFSVSLDIDGHVNESGNDFVYDGKDEVVLDYTIEFTDGCSGCVSILYYQKGALLNAYVMNSQDNINDIDRELEKHIAAIAKIGNAFAKNEIKEKELQDIILSDKYSAKLYDYEFMDNILRNYYEPNVFNNYEYTQAESYISEKKYYEKLAIECYMKDLID